MGILGEGGAYGTDGGGQLEGFEYNDETGDTLQRYDDTTIRRYKIYCDRGVGIQTQA